MCSELSGQRPRAHRLKSVAAANQSPPQRLSGIDIRSLDIIRAECNLSRFQDFEQRVIARIIQECGMVDIADDIVMSNGFVVSARLALLSSAPILCDTHMVAAGILRPSLPAKNEVICKIDDPDTAQRACDAMVSHAAAAVDFWKPFLLGAVVVIGASAPALCRLLAHLKRGWPKPAAIIGLPAGSLPASEIKAELLDYSEVPFLTIPGQKGGSVIATAAVNALANSGE